MVWNIPESQSARGLLMQLLRVWASTSHKVSEKKDYLVKLSSPTADNSHRDRGH